MELFTERKLAGRRGYREMILSGDHVMVKELLLMNYAAVMLTICLLIFILTNNYFHTRVRGLFFISCVLLLFLITDDSVEYWAASLDHLLPVRIWMSAIGYSLRPAIILLIIWLINPGEKMMRWLVVPLVFNVMIAWSALFTNVAYSYTPDNQFVRGPIGYFAFVTSGFYLIVLIIYTFRLYRLSNVSEMLISIVDIALIVIATILESVAKCEGMINTTGAITLVFYYVYLNTQQFKRDALTGALNRRCFYLDAEKNDANLRAVISIDLNNLKQWNDEYGHAKGDDAIRTLAACVQGRLTRGCYLYRTGGDEFMVLCFGKEETEIENMLKGMRVEMKKTPYACAIGAAYRTEGEEFQKLCSRADQQMYVDKFRMKQESENPDPENVQG